MVFHHDASMPRRLRASGKWPYICGVLCFPQLSKHALRATHGTQCSPLLHDTQTKKRGGGGVPGGAAPQVRRLGRSTWGTWSGPSARGSMSIYPCMHLKQSAPRHLLLAGEGCTACRIKTQTALERSKPRGRTAGLSQAIPDVAERGPGSSPHPPTRPHARGVSKAQCGPWCNCNAGA